MVAFERNGFVFQLRDVLQKRTITLLSCHELVNHLLHVCIASTSPHHDERLFGLRVLRHQLLHLLLVQFGPNFLYKERSSKLSFILIFAFVLRVFADFSLIKNAVLSFLYGVFLVFDGLIKRYNPIRPVHLLPL